jgi:hypothetical protein
MNHAVVQDRIYSGEALTDAQRRHLASCPQCQAHERSAHLLDKELDGVARSYASEQMPPMLVGETTRAIGSNRFLPAPVAIALVAAIAVGGVVGSSLGWFRPGTQSALPTGSGEATESLPSSPLPEGLRFGLVDDADLFPGAMSAVAEQGGVVLAGGQSCDADVQCSAVIWQSNDGRNWSAPRLLPGPADGNVVDLLADHGRWIAVGRNQIWFSSNGESWRQSTGNFTDGLADGGPTIPVSEDTCCGVELHRVLAVPEGYVAVGGVVCYKCNGRAAVWLSPDGENWDRVPYADSLQGYPMDDLMLLRNGRLLAVGEEDAWTSDDGGHSWQRQPNRFPRAVARGVVGQTTGEAIVVAADRETGPASVWQSRDGLQWRSQVLPLSDVYIEAMVNVAGVTLLTAEKHFRTIDPAHRELVAYAIGQELSLEPIQFEPGRSAEGDTDIINDITATEHGLVAVGVTVTAAANFQQAARVWVEAVAVPPSPSATATLGPLVDGIPIHISGLPVLAGRDLERWIGQSEDDTSFLAGGWLRKNPPTYYCAIFLSDRAVEPCNGVALYPDAEGGNPIWIGPGTVGTMPNDFRDLTRPVVLRVHTHDSRCSTEEHGCEQNPVVLDVIWIGPPS